MPMKQRSPRPSSPIDSIHVNFSADIICLLNLIAPDTCTYENNALPWMKIGCGCRPEKSC